MPKLPPEEPESLRNRSALNADRLQRALPGWSRVSQYLSSRGFYLYQNTKMVYLPEGALLLEDILGRIKAAERFIFMEYFILAEGKLWDRMSAALCERARSGVEVKIIFDDFGNIKRFSAESLQTLRDAGVEVIVFNPVHEYVNRLYFNYRDHRKITVIDGETGTLYVDPDEKTLADMKKKKLKLKMLTKKMILKYKIMKKIVLSIVKT